MNDFARRVGFLYWLTWQVLRGFFNVWHRLQVTGAENIPDTDGVILASNHLSHWDSFAMGCSVRRRIGFVADKKMFKRPLFGWFLAAIGGVALTRGKGRGGEMLDDASGMIGKDSLLIIYPEGTRSRSGVPGRSRTGIIVMAAKTGAPIVPCRVTGTSESLPIGAKFLRPSKISVAYGKPIRFGKDEIDLENREKLMEQSEEVMDVIMSLPGKFPPNAEMSEDEWWDIRRKSRQSSNE